MMKLMNTVAHVLERIGAMLDWLPPLVSRFAVGVGFVITGWGKIHHFDKVINFFTNLKIPHPEFAAHLTGFSELIFGLLVVIGLATRLSVIPLIIVMITAMATATFPGFAADSSSDLSTYLLSEELLIAIILLWLFIRGAGAVSVDGLIKHFTRGSEKTEH